MQVTLDFFYASLRHGVEIIDPENILICQKNVEDGG